MTDAEHAAVLRRIMDDWLHLGPGAQRAAIERAIELLEREADAQDAFESGAYQ